MKLQRNIVPFKACIVLISCLYMALMPPTVQAWDPPYPGHDPFKLKQTAGTIGTADNAPPKRLCLPIQLKGFCAGIPPERACLPYGTTADDIIAQDNILTQENYNQQKLICEAAEGTRWCGGDKVCQKKLCPNDPSRALERDTCDNKEEYCQANIQPCNEDSDCLIEWQRCYGVCHPCESRRVCDAKVLNNVLAPKGSNDCLNSAARALLSLGSMTVLVLSAVLLALA
eukprot:TRINITY_DN964_c1_g1_i8.p1 TRINITY_DN964_c1_g1~~TRINITY_DN964_c1_g1_i8.p1  ORF type:complete len:228 (+),score=19.54 TRINITY_DN964_c1_g1_i8:225-908(+)